MSWGVEPEQEIWTLKMSKYRIDIDDWEEMEYDLPSRYFAEQHARTYRQAGWDVKLELKYSTIEAEKERKRREKLARARKGNK